MNRRAFLATGAASAVVAGLARHGTAVGAAPPDAPKWRAFEVTTRAEIVNPTGGARPAPAAPRQPAADYHKSQGQRFARELQTTPVDRAARGRASKFSAGRPRSTPSPLLEASAP